MMIKNRKIVCLSAALFLIGCLAGCDLSPETGNEGQMHVSKVMMEESIQMTEQQIADSGDEEADVNGMVPDESGQASEEFPENSDNEETNQKPEIKLIMVGDVLLHTPVAKSGRLPEGGYDFTHLFEHVSKLTEAADLKLVNQEVIIGGEQLGVSGYPAFNAPNELGDALALAGFNVVLHATNHALDKGKAGLLNCLAYWKTEHPDMAVLGIYDSEESSENIYVYEKDGLKIAILNYTYGTNGIPLPENMPYCVNLLQEAKVKSDLQKAEELADFTIVCPHWGTEYVLRQTKAQEKWMKLFVENGADLIIGTHPHVIEPVEVWEEDGRKVPVFYSLGNFVNWTSGTGDGVANRMVGAMAQVTITVDEEGCAYAADWEALPLVSHVESGFGNVTVYPLSEYSEELAQRNEIRKQDSHFSYRYCQKLVEDVFDADVLASDEQ